MTATTAVAAGSPHFRGDLQAQLDALAHKAEPGKFGISVLDLESGKRWGVDAGSAYPMMSVFKAPLGATVLAQADAGKISLSQHVTIRRADLRTGASRIAEEFRGEQMTFTVQELLVDAVSYSDNTAADALVRLIGGPQVITSFLEGHGIRGLHVDIDEGGVSHVFSGLGVAAQPPEGETKAEREHRLERGYDAYLSDPRNRSTPDAAVAFLQTLWNGRLLPTKSTKHLLDLLYGQTKPSRLRAGIPAGVRLADKCGTSESLHGRTAAFNDIGIMTWPDGRTVIVAAFLTGSKASQAERNQLFADLAHDVGVTLHP
ncbi:class A beta-lactamase [Faunimonas pinastri]|nr:class A beta-lactamase [Faunimonas pinastri]